MKINFIKTLDEKTIEVLYLITAIISWQLVADRIVHNKILLPSFYDVIIAFFATLISGQIFADILTSLLHFSIGIVSAFAIGIPLGIAMGWFKQANRGIDPLIKMLRLISPLAWTIFAILWIPFAIIWFGLTHEAVGFIVFVGTVFPIAINTYSGFKNVPKVYIEAGDVFGCKRNIDLIHCIAISSSLPSIVAGIRIALGVGWMSLVAAEYLMWGVSTNGLGYQISHNYSLLRINYVFVYLLFLGFVNLFIDQFFRHYIDAKLR